LKAYKKHKAKKSDVVALYNFFTRTAQNPLYAAHELDMELLARMPDEDTSFIVEQPETEIAPRNVGYDPIAANEHGNPNEILERGSLLAQPRPFFEASLMNEAVKKTPLVLSRQSTGLLTRTTPRLLAKMYPWLFPWGRGDFDDPERRVKIGFEAYCRYLLPLSRFDACCSYLLSLSDRRFAQDPTFLLFAFDSAARNRMLSKANARVHLVPRDNMPIASLSKEQVEQFYAYQGQREDALRNHTPLPPPPVSALAAAPLERGVSATTAAYLGSNEERAVLHRRLQSLVLEKGIPHVWITLNWNDLHSPFVAHYADRRVVLDLDALGPDAVLSKDERRRLIGRDPVAAAIAFDRAVKLFLHVLLAVDEATGKPLATRGILGHVNKYFGCIETQDRGALHVHFLIWLVGFPDTIARFDELLADELFADRYGRYVDATVKTQLPFDTAQAPCPECLGEHALQPLRLPEKAARPFAAWQAAPNVAKCSNCTETFTASDLVRKMMKQRWPERNLDELKESLLSSPQGIAWPPPDAPERTRIPDCCSLMIVDRCTRSVSARPERGRAGVPGARAKAHADVLQGEAGRADVPLRLPQEAE
jgi:hypothetical protein